METWRCSHNEVFLCSCSSPSPGSSDTSHSQTLHLRWLSLGCHRVQHTQHHTEHHHDLQNINRVKITPCHFAVMHSLIAKMSPSPTMLAEAVVHASHETGTVSASSAHATFIRHPFGAPWSLVIFSHFLRRQYKVTEFEYKS